MSAEQRAEWRRLTDAAPAGPWVLHEGGLWHGITKAELDAVDADLTGSTGETIDWDIAKPVHGSDFDDDLGAFVAEARTAVPELLDAIDRVLSLHFVTNVTGKARCNEDTLSWPCPTAQAIEVAS